VPTYQYRCTECGHGFEQFQSFSDDALTECPTCGGRLRKVFNSVGIVFKGSGFYRNDSREAAAKAQNKDGKSKESVGSDKSDSSSDKSSDTKSDKQSDKQSDRQSDRGGAGPDKKSDSTAAAASSSSSGKGSGSASSSGSSSGGSSSGSSSTAGSAA
jgi:putative FmdB family regulatory protein